MLLASMELSRTAAPSRRCTPKTTTGCITCKIRRVKCDEARPSCTRCISTGRKCDGYVRQPYATVLSAGVKLHVSVPEYRALDFFHRHVAAAIAGTLDLEAFWTRTVHQASQSEPAVRHAIVAISSLYEHLGTEQTFKTNAFAIQHYNRAITELVRATPDESVLLAACVLMVCVELLLGNVPAAIVHCRHGVAILNRSSVLPSTRRQLLPIFCRLSIPPHFFGHSPSTFPLLKGLDLPDAALAADPYPDPARLRAALEILSYRAARLLRTGVESRRSGIPIPPAALREQRRLSASLTHWATAFDGFRTTTATGPSGAWVVHALDLKQLLVAVWVDCALAPDEATYDRHLDAFRTIVRLAALVLATDTSSDCPQQPRRPRFTFEMGLLPVLSFVSIKCRCLRTRVAALRLMRARSAARENVWDADVALRIGRRVVLLENGVDVGEMDLEGFEGVADEGVADEVLWEGPDVTRIPDVEMESVFEVDADGAGWRIVSLFAMGDKDKVLLVRERVLV
ncbi:C6 zinc finger protein [Lasiosphaeria hispida]|uniref:C6 zinc finger protein n=1 Tax=Lasiosphaeria hispida TaxID=260671 RepID=A0AAJ0MF25_9PEZI|nr:C6 zinc finger protein [Lasiosphaeria hispida]